MQKTAEVPRGADLEDTIDFINTLEHARRGDIEHLPTPADALEWLAERGLLEAGEPRVAGLGDGPARQEPGDGATAAPILERVRRARAALRAVVDAIVERRTPEGWALDEVNRLLAGRPAPVLVPAPDGVDVAARPAPDPIDAALGRLAAPIVELVAGGARDRLRTCANETCRWVFYDASRTGRRRWCEMATCGNRAKAARHRARHRARGRDGRPIASPAEA